MHLHFVNQLTTEVGRRTRRPYVVTVHEGAQISYLRPGMRGYPYPSGPLHEHLKRQLLRGASTVICLCEREKDALQGHYSIDADRIVQIPNGVDVSQYQRSDLLRGGDDIVIISIGQMRAHKGYDYLIRAFAEIHRRFPSTRLRLIGHRHDLVPGYMSLASRLGIESAVDFIAGLSTEQLASELESADVYIQPSLAECAPITILEAMASGLPVIASDIACIRDQLGEAGVLVPPADTKRLVDALTDLIADPLGRAALGSAARTRCIERFTMTKVTQSHLEVYERAAFTPRPRTRRLHSVGFRATCYLHYSVDPRIRATVRPVAERIAPQAIARRRAHHRGASED